MGPVCFAAGNTLPPAAVNDDLGGRLSDFRPDSCCEPLTTGVKDPASWEVETVGKDRCPIWNGPNR